MASRDENDLHKKLKDALKKADVGPGAGGGGGGGSVVMTVFGPGGGGGGGPMQTSSNNPAMGVHGSGAGYDGGPLVSLVGGGGFGGGGGGDGFSLKKIAAQFIPKKHYQNAVDHALFTEKKLLKAAIADLAKKETSDNAYKGFKPGDFIETAAEFNEFLAFMKPFYPDWFHIEDDYNFAQQEMLIDCSVGNFHTVKVIHLHEASKTFVKYVLDSALLEFDNGAPLPTLGGVANEGTNMALKLNAFNGLVTLKKIGVPQVLFDWLSKNGKVEYEGGSFVLTVGFVHTKVVVPLAHVQAANLGTMPAHIKQKYQKEFAAALNSIHHEWVKYPGADGLKAEVLQPGFSKSFPHILAETVEKAASGLVEDLYGLPAIIQKDLEEVLTKNELLNPDPAGSKIGAALKKGFSLTEAQKAHVKELPTLANITGPTIEVVTTPAWPCFDFVYLKSAPLVKLYAADRLYQPVAGSTPGKRYYAVAFNKEFRVGAAYNGSELSIRIESPQWQEHFAKLGPIFPVSPQKGYTSMHVEVENDMMAAKVMGAVLSGLGLAWETPLPNLQVIKGK